MGIYILFHGFYGAIFGIIYIKKVIQNIIGNEILLILKNRILLKLIKNADIVITRGLNSKNLLITHGIQKHKIYYPPNVFNFDDVPLLSSPKKYKYDIIYIGALAKIKRLDILLKALHILKSKYNIQNFKATIVGTGPLEKYLKKLTKQLNLTHNISFLGKQNNIYPLLHQSKIFAMTSDYEGFPMAMVEAMSCGLPCIMPDISNITSVAINEYNSLLVSVGNTEKYAAAIYQLLTDNVLYEKLAKNALKIREEKRVEYSLENVTNIWEQILAQLK